MVSLDTRHSPLATRHLGFISFENSGELLIPPVAHEDSMKKMGIITDRVVNFGGFAEPQQAFLEFHRTNVFLK